jgi:hypothetical protein
MIKEYNSSVDFLDFAKFTPVLSYGVSRETRENF